MCKKTITRCLYPLVLVIPHYLQAAPACTEAVAKILSAQGRVDMQPYGSSGWQRIHQDDTVCPGDTLRTLKWSRATLALRSKAVITLDQGTTMSFSPPKQAAQSWFINLLEGAAFFRSRQPQTLDVHTPFINAVHKGTEFMVTVTGQQTEISVFDGQVQGESSTGNITIDKGFKGIAEANRPPRLQALKVTPEDAVQWTLYYPPLVDTSGSPTGKESALAPALLAYRQGDGSQALARLEEIPAAQQNAGYLTLKAALLLAVGRVDEAQPLIRQAQNQEPNNADAFALQAVIAVAKNQQQQALALANQAVSAKPNSPVAKIAQSYAYQSLFNIDEALKATQEATRITPDNGLAWARLSELQLSKGDRAAALASAQKAQALNPKLARTQTVLGFASLAQTDIQNAKQAFGQALALDSSDPIARLGLGLAKIRQGDVEDGKDELETAVNLDPNNAVIRSYLGKAYYELRNKDYAGTEYNIAKDMDPKDPTPWFYDAILKQTTNRPVEALHDMQKAIELNDNRAVYRSSLLLDKDLAARSAAQGRIYNDLGFQRLGLLEGWKSTNIDPSNYSAHRLLADSYAAQPLHEIARVSELLQSQLLQPINITPIQPQLAQSNILIVDGLGPSALSFNEFNPLFARNRFALQTSGIYGGNNTWGEDVVHSGLWGKASYSLGQFHYQTDGFRQNNGLKQNIYNAFIQGDITNSLNLQAEYRHESRNNGDLSVNFGQDNFSSAFKETKTIDSYRLGGRFEFSPKSTFLGSLIYQEINGVQKDTRLDTQLVTITPPPLPVTLPPDPFAGSPFPGAVPPDPFAPPSPLPVAVQPAPITVPITVPITTTNIENRKGFTSELQHLYSGDSFNVVSGFGHIDQAVKTRISLGDTGISLNAVGRPDISRTNLYNYTNFHITDSLTATVGLSYDHLVVKNAFERNPVNPKFGVIWKPFASTVFRAAAFRGLNITHTANQTLEPTQVAGFNQLFDDRDGTIAWRYGAGIDHKFSKNIQAGLEYTERNLNLPNVNSPPYDWKETLSKAYLFITPNEYVALSAEYFYEKFNRQLADLTLPKINSFNATNHRIPLTVSWYHPSGFSFMVKGTYLNQSGVFINQFTNGNNSLGTVPGNSNFFIVDLNLNYRLPARYGMVSFGVKNLFDTRFQYQDINSTQSTSSENYFAPAQRCLPE